MPSPSFSWSLAGSLGVHIAVAGGLAWVALTSPGSSTGPGASVTLTALSAPLEPALAHEAEPERTLELTAPPEPLLVEAELPPLLEPVELLAEAPSESLADPSRTIARLLAVPWTSGAARGAVNAGEAGPAPGGAAESGATEPSEAPAQPSTPVHVGAAMRSTPDPSYPRLSRRLEEQGTVELSLHVLADGTVGSVSIVKSSGYERLDEAAVAGVRSWVFEPATRDGVAVESDFAHRVTFRLEEP